MALACLLLFVSASPALAKRDYLEKLQGVFGLTEHGIGRCALCHNVKPNEKAGKGNLGLYGKDIQQVMNTNEQIKFNVDLIAVSLFKKDSDGDGVTNMEEFALGSFPGDPKSVPAKDALEAYRKRVAALEAQKQKEGAARPGTDKTAGGSKTMKK
ncbi:MAG TPA: hypothetical protein VEK08_05430 [Planctomycetota bacterium]|nr:hypothetical protein [Planctomycetota bacterium]